MFIRGNKVFAVIVYYLAYYNSEKKLKHDTYLAPYSAVEMAILCLEQDRIEDVKRYLERAK